MLIRIIFVLICVLINKTLHADKNNFCFNMCFNQYPKVTFIVVVTIIGLKTIILNFDGESICTCSKGSIAIWNME